MPTTQSSFRLMASLLVFTAWGLAAEARQEVPLNEDWAFWLGDPPDAETVNFDSSAWERLDIPHDWAFRADYDVDAAQEDMGGYKPGGIGWYRRTVEWDPSWTDNRVRLEFDGVYMDSRVWINGQWVGGRPYGYMSFGLDVSEHLKSGTNVIAVRVDNSLEPSARWYHPCGIYAPVKLVVVNPLHIVPNGVFIKTDSLTDRRAAIEIETTLSGPIPSDGRLVTRILDPNDREVVSAVTEGRKAENASQILSVPHPQRWDIHSPLLYTAVSEIMIGDEIVDSVKTRFGIRTIRWDTDTGFWINDRNVKLKGVADHLEAGPVGGEAHPNLIRWKIQLLKEMGVNAIRVAHNPQVPEFYRACDEMGMLVMDEIFDGWHQKAPQDYGARFFAEHWETDLTEWVKRNRNHPSVIIYSIGNETRGEIAPRLVQAIKSLDSTRLVTSGHSGSEHVDVFGVNGHSEKQHFFEQERPAKPFIATEAPHTWQVRGYYRTKTWWRDGFPNRRQDPFPLADLTENEIFRYDWAPAAKKTSGKQVFNSSYDNATVRISARKNWELMRDLPWFSGHFRWTGFDYLGEAGYVHGGWPFRAFMGGALDLAGFKKDLFYFYQSQWTREPMVHILPHWTHPRMELGTMIPVWVYSNADEVELFLNGQSLGRDRPGVRAEEMQCEWLVPWEPGVIEAVAYKNGREVARSRHVSAGVPTRIQVQPETISLSASALPFSIVTVSQHDNDGNFYPYGENRMFFHLEGAAEIISLENGNPVDTEPNFGQDSRRTFFGLTRAFVRITDPDGDVSLTVGSINGERRHLTSNMVSFDLRQVGLQGNPQSATLRIHYTLDGSEPHLKSPVYQAPFPVELGTGVRAGVFRKDALLFEMREHFAPDVGIHWLAPGEPEEVAGQGLQAEDSRLSGGTSVSADISGHYGTGYAVLPPGEHAQLYRENDGSFGQFAFRIRYRANADSKIELRVNNGRSQTVNLPASGQRWSVVKTTHRLERGGNTISIVNQGTGAVLLDEIEVSSQF